MELNTKGKYLSPGVVLDNKYTIKKHLASGGFGHTYLATDRMGRQVVVKEFYLSNACSRDIDSRTVIVTIESNKEVYYKQKQKFLREARRIYGLNHKNIVKVFDLFEENDTAYYVMDYVDGIALAQLQKPISEIKAISYLGQILSALKCVHNMGLMHLDIKPSNIMIDKDENTYLIDFGASKQFDPSSDNQSVVNTTGLAYTPEYASFEQMSGHVKNLGSHSDMYSLGATFYNMLTGKTPPSPSDLMEEGFTEKGFASPLMVDLITNLMQVSIKSRIKNVEEVEARYAALFNGGDSTIIAPSATMLMSDATTMVSPQAPTMPPTPTPIASPTQKVSSPQYPSRNPNVEPVKPRKNMGYILLGVAIILLVGIIVGLKMGGDTKESKEATYVEAPQSSQEQEMVQQTAPASNEATAPVATSTQRESVKEQPAIDTKSSRDGYYSFDGYFTNGKSQWPIKITFTIDGYQVKNCTYDNLSQDYKQQTWPATFDGNQLVISGKNGKKAMTIYLQFDDESGNSMSGSVGEMDVVLYR